MSRTLPIRTGSVAEALQGSDARRRQAITSIRESAMTELTLSDGLMAVAQASSDFANMRGATNLSLHVHREEAGCAWTLLAGEPISISSSTCVISSGCEGIAEGAWIREEALGSWRVGVGLRWGGGGATGSGGEPWAGAGCDATSATWRRQEIPVRGASHRGRVGGLGDHGILHN